MREDAGSRAFDPFLGRRGHVDSEVPLAESDLYQIEEISAKEVSRDRLRTETNFELKLPEIWMGKANPVKSSLNCMARCRLEWDPPPIEQVETYCSPNQSIE